MSKPCWDAITEVASNILSLIESKTGVKYDPDLKTNPTGKGKEEYLAAVKELKESTIEDLASIHKQIKGEEVPPQTPEPPKKELPEGDNKVGVSHKSLTGLAKSLGLKEPERGDYIEPKEYAERGRKLLEAGATLEDANNPANNLHDRISIARAHLEDLTSIADKAAKEKGVESNEYKEALGEVEKYANGAVKELGTLAHRAMVSLQGERDINTGSFTQVKAAFEKSKGSKATPEENQKITELTNENENLKQRASDLEKKLIEATDKHLSGGHSNTAKAKKIIEGNKKRNDEEADLIFQSAKRDFVAARVAKEVEGGKTIEESVDGIAKEGLIKPENADKAKKYFNDLVGDKTTEEKNAIKEKSNITRLENQLADLRAGIKKEKPEEREKSQKEIELENEIQLEKNKQVVKLFADKTGNKFTPDEARTLWEYAKTNYLDKGINYKDMLSFVSNDLGLSWRQISDAITSPKVKPISDAMYRRQADLRKVQIKVKDFVDKANRSVGAKLLKGVSDLFRGVAVFAHGHIFVGTHAGMTLFDVPRARYTLKAFINGFRNAYGNSASYERRMEELRNEPNFTLAQRAGLQNDPNETNMDEYQKYSKVFGKIGDTGVKGFNAIKILRQDLFDSHFNKLDAAKKADPAVAESIAELVNNATGGTNIKMPKWTQEIAFAANMEAARWEKLTSNPVKATSTAIKAIFTPEKATPAERVFAKVWATRVGWEVATYASVLGINAALQGLWNPKNPVNLTDPSSPDYLKFKVGDKDVNMTSGMLSSIQLVGKLAQASAGSQKALRGDTRLQAIGKTGIGYARGKLAPFAGTVADVATHVDFAGNVLPFSNDKPRTGKYNLTWGEYLWEKAPIPIADAAKNVYEGMHENGLSKPQIEQWFSGIVGFLEAGSTGFKINESYSKHSPFTDEDKKDPTFKYFLDKGMELPNVSLAATEITDQEKKTKKKVTDYPKDIQDKYVSEHKKELKAELASIIDNDVAYIKTYTGAKGEKINEVSIDKPEGKYDTVEISKMTDQDELAQVLKIAQSKATKKAKENVFYIKTKKRF